MAEKENGRGAKQIIVIRKDLNMRKGKIAAQAAHASCAVLTNLMKGPSGLMKKDEDNYHYEINHKVEALDYWLTHRFVKIGVSVNSEQELLDLYNKAKEKGLLCSLIKDAGFTEFKGVETYTTVAIGPAWDDEFIGLTDHLPLF